MKQGEVSDIGSVAAGPTRETLLFPPNTETEPRATGLGGVDPSRATGAPLPHQSPQISIVGVSHPSWSSAVWRTKIRLQHWSEQ